MNLNLKETVSSWKIPQVTETTLSCRQDFVQSHGIHCQGNWVEEIAGTEARWP